MVIFFNEILRIQPLSFCKQSWNQQITTNLLSWKISIRYYATFLQTECQTPNPSTPLPQLLWPAHTSLKIISQAACDIVLGEKLRVVKNILSCAAWHIHWPVGGVQCQRQGNLNDTHIASKILWLWCKIRIRNKNGFHTVINKKLDKACHFACLQKQTVIITFEQTSRNLERHLLPTIDLAESTMVHHPWRVMQGSPNHVGGKVPKNSTTTGHYWPVNSDVLLHLRMRFLA